MAEKYTFTNEAKVVFNYIKKDLVSQFPTDKISSYYYIYSVLSNKDCLAYKALEKLFFTESLNSLENDCYTELTNSSSSAKAKAKEPKYNKIYDDVLEKCNEKGDAINSCLFLYNLLLIDGELYKLFKKYGITPSQIEGVMEATVTENSDSVSVAKEKEKKKPKSKQKKDVESTPKPQIINGKYPENTDVEKNLIDLNKMAVSGKLDKAIGNRETIDKIFTALLKRDKNNVILVGDSGCGKTCTVQHIANMIVEGNVPKYFKDKKLMKMDFISLTSGTGFRGGFETKYQNIIESAAKSGRYIFFIDDIHSILSGNSKFTEVATDVMLDDILNNKNIMFICATTHDNYSKYIEPNKNLVRRFEKVVLADKDGKDKFDIIKKVAAKYEKYHFVSYSDEVISTAINLAQRFFGNADIYTVGDILDTAAATELMKVKNDEKHDKLIAELTEIQNKIEEIKTKSDSESYKEYDTLCADEIKKKSEINIYEKKVLSEKKPLPVTLKSLYECVSKKTDIPVGEIGKTELEKLKNIDSRLKEKVIGQDEAIEVLCKAVRRQRVGLGNPNKPVVCLMSGTSGCGKTFLAKKLAEEVFGSEKNMVRLDMSEYADKISVNKLIGSSAGYIGYDEGGLLTEAIKKNNHCVLLLDEIEKANEEIYNTFLQVFDEGRLTDNKGTTVDFRNVIILMTSNIGTKEAANKKPLIGFGDKSEDTRDKDIILSTIKKKLPPEFINRIDEIMFMNKLTDDNLKTIIDIEIRKIEDRVKKLGYSFDESIFDGELPKNVFEEVKKESEYGARPILRELRRQLEDKLTDYLLETTPKKGYKIKYTDIYKENSDK